MNAHGEKYLTVGGIIAAALSIGGILLLWKKANNIELDDFGVTEFDYGGRPYEQLDEEVTGAGAAG